MKSQRIMNLLLAVVLVVSASACVMPASKAPQAGTTPSAPTGTIPVPGTNDAMARLEAFATQTAMALSGTPVVTATLMMPIITNPITQTQETPVAAGATPTPAPAAEETPVPQSSGQAAAYPTLTPGIPKSYTLQKGEHPYCIARRFNVNPSELLSANGLGTNSLFAPGLELKIPQSGGSFPGDRSLKNHPTSYTVSGGDTIYSIACDFGDVDPNEIILANNLKSPYKLSSGQELYIP